MNIPWNKFSLPIKESNDIIAVNKGINVLSHPNNCNISNKSIVLAEYDFTKEAYKLANDRYLYLLNRLDSPTSGIVLLTPNLDIATIVRKEFELHMVKKTYCAVVKGFLQTGKTFVWKDEISTFKTQNNTLRSKIGDKDASFAITKTKVDKFIKICDSLCCQIILNPQTGRTHQLRIQCASRKHNILGDKTYGDFSLNKRTKANRLYLHALNISINTSKITFDASTEIPWQTDFV